MMQAMSVLFQILYRVFIVTREGRAVTEKQSKPSWIEIKSTSLTALLISVSLDQSVLLPERLLTIAAMNDDQQEQSVVAWMTDCSSERMNGTKCRRLSWTNAPADSLSEHVFLFALEQHCRRWCTSRRLYISVTMRQTSGQKCFTMESLPNEIVLLIFNYLKASDIVCAFFFLKRRYARLIEEFRPFSTSINLTDVSTSVFNLYSSLLFRTYHIDSHSIQNLRLDCSMLQTLSINELSFPRLQSLSIVVRKTDDLAVLLKYFPFFTNMQQLYIRSDVCCCDRILFEESVKQNLFESSRTQLRSLTFATPPCYSISLQDINFEQSLFTNLTVSNSRWPWSIREFFPLVNRSFDEWLLLDSQQCSSSAFVAYSSVGHARQSAESVDHRHRPTELESSSLHLSAFDFLRGDQEHLQDVDTVDEAELLLGVRSSIGDHRWASSSRWHLRPFSPPDHRSIRNQIVDFGDFQRSDRVVQDSVLVAFLADRFSFVQSYLHTSISVPSPRSRSIDLETWTDTTVDQQLEVRSRSRSLRTNDVHQRIPDVSTRRILSLNHVDLEMEIRFDEHFTNHYQLVLSANGPSPDHQVHAPSKSTIHWTDVALFTRLRHTGLGLCSHRPNHRLLSSSTFPGRVRQAIASSARRWTASRLEDQIEARSKLLLSTISNVFSKHRMSSVQINCSVEMQMKSICTNLPNQRRRRSGDLSNENIAQIRFLALFIEGFSQYSQDVRSHSSFYRGLAYPFKLRAERLF